MTNSVKVSFSQESVEKAIGLENSNSKITIDLNSLSNENQLADYHVACVAVILNGGKICVDIPFFGEYCFSLPVELPIGTEVSVCLDIKTTFRIPTGATISVKLDGKVIYKFSIGL